MWGEKPYSIRVRPEGVALQPGTDHQLCHLIGGLFLLLGSPNEVMRGDSIFKKGRCLSYLLVQLCKLKQKQSSRNNEKNHLFILSLQQIPDPVLLQRRGKRVKRAQANEHVRTGGSGGSDRRAPGAGAGCSEMSRP